MNQTIAAVLKWRKASRELAHLGADNYFQHSPDKEQLFKEKREQVQQLREKMNIMLDEEEARGTQLRH